LIAFWQAYFKGTFTSLTVSIYLEPFKRFKALNLTIDTPKIVTNATYCAL